MKPSPRAPGSSCRFLTPILTYIFVSKRVFESRISSSRVYCSFTGRRALRASSAASAFFRVRRALGAEPAADVAGDHADVAVGQVEQRREAGVHAERRLRGAHIVSRSPSHCAMTPRGSMPPLHIVGQW